MVFIHAFVLHAIESWDHYFPPDKYTGTPTSLFDAIMNTPFPVIPLPRNQTFEMMSSNSVVLNFFLIVDSDSGIRTAVEPSLKIKQCNSYGHMLVT